MQMKGSVVAMNTSLRPLIGWATALACAFGATHANAQLRLPVNTLTADSVQTFSQDALGAFDLKGVSITAKGNTRASDASYRMPITELYLGPSKYTGVAGAIYKGGAVGSALLISRASEVTGQRIGLTLANFRINYHSKQVVADVTPLGGKTTPEQAIYNFKVVRPIVQEPNAQGKLALEEVLGDLRFTPETIRALVNALELDEIDEAVISDLDNGKLVQKIDLTPRAATPAAPYIPF